MATIRAGHRTSATLVPRLFNGDDMEAESVDIFLSSHVIEHHPNPCLWMSQVWRVLRPGGVVFTEVPNQGNDRRVQENHGEFHLSFFTAETFTGMMESNGGFTLLKQDIVSRVLTKYPPPIRSLHQKIP